MAYDVGYWNEVRQRIASMGRIDAHHELLFGSATHKYAIFAPVSEERLYNFELLNDIELPQEYRSFLAAFGAGGAGPDHGIENFAQLETESVRDRFHLTETQDWPDDDNDPIWALPGLLTICTSGCATDWSIEINGPQPGTMWVNAGPGDMLMRQQTFGAWYAKWLDRVEQGLQKYETILGMIALGAKMPQILADCECEAVEIQRDKETYVKFTGVPGRFRTDGNDLTPVDVGASWIK